MAVGASPRPASRATPSISLADVLGRLKSSGTAQNAAIARRRGAGDNLYGVSMADATHLAHEIGTDHQLALALWNTGNADAQTLATMVVDPARMSERALASWLKGLTHHELVSLVVRNVARRVPDARANAEHWMQSKREYTAQAGWDLLAVLATEDRSLPDAYFDDFIPRIEATIFAAKNRTRHAMNNALIAIGMRSERLRKRALVAAARIGKVEVDHGDTGGRTPDAAAYIKRAAARKAAG